MPCNIPLPPPPAPLSKSQGPLCMFKTPAPVPRLHHSTCTPCTSTPVSAVSQPAAILEYLSTSAKKIGDEIQLESTLHVTSVQAVTCEEEYHHRLSSAELLTDAPSLSDPLMLSGGDGQAQVDEREANTRALAACLATPEDIPDNKGELRSRLLQSRVLSNPSDMVADNVERFSAWMSRVRKARRKSRLGFLKPQLAPSDLYSKPARPNRLVTQSTDSDDEGDDYQMGMEQL